MPVTVTAEQQALREAVAGLVAKVWLPRGRRHYIEGSPEPADAIWRAISTDLELCGIMLAPEHGGGGGDFRDVSIVLEELGRGLAAADYLMTAAVVGPLLDQGAPAELRATWVPRIAAGEVRGTLAATEAGGDRPLPATTAVEDPAGRWRVTGDKTEVIGSAQQDFVIVSATIGLGEPALLLVPLTAQGVAVTDHPVLDLTRGLLTVGFAHAPGELVARGDAARELLRSARQRAIAGQTVEQAGYAAHCVAETVAYVKVREQFGRPVGSFQAVQFMCADMLIDAESARSVAYHAVEGVAEATDDVARRCHIAKAVCGEAVARVCGQMIQVHGGIGYTWEHDAHLYFKRAYADQQLLGGTGHHYEQLLTELGY